LSSLFAHRDQFGDFFDCSRVQDRQDMAVYKEKEVGKIKSAENLAKDKTAKL
jgi:hypothetical protein